MDQQTLAKANELNSKIKIIEEELEKFKCATEVNKETALKIFNIQCGNLIIALEELSISTQLALLSMTEGMLRGTLKGLQEEFNALSEVKV